MRFKFLDFSKLLTDLWISHTIWALFEGKNMEQKSVDNRKLYMFAFKAFGDFSGTIAIPAVAAALLGKWLDSRYATEPKIMIALLIIAFALTALVIVKKTKEYGREYQELFTEEGRNT